MSRLPTLFISHGSPMLAMTDSPARKFLQGLGQSLPRPRAILMVSAHWETAGSPAVSLAAEPATMHDFGGFPAELFAIAYPAHGAPEIAGQAAVLLEQAGHTVTRSPDRGLDHGAWVPLRLMYPETDIPVFQLSVLQGVSPAGHEYCGSALSALRNAGVLIIGSGSMTHNLHEFRGQGIDAHVPSWVSDFDEWMLAMLGQNEREALHHYRRLAPFAERNHPTEEHLMPLFVAMGAAGKEAIAERVHASYQYGILAMDVYVFS